MTKTELDTLVTDYEVRVLLSITGDDNEAFSVRRSMREAIVARVGEYSFSKMSDWFINKHLPLGNFPP